MKTLKTVLILMLVAALTIAVGSCNQARQMLAPVDGSGDDTTTPPAEQPTAAADPADGEPAEPAEEIADEADGPDITVPEGMAYIPAGTFQMGSDYENMIFENELPIHTVHVDAFYMDKYEVTNAQFKAFVDANPEWSKNRIDARFHNGLYLRDWNDNNYPAGQADKPVVFVSWYAAMAYAQWAGKRLPTEAEWEYAARGGLTGKKYPWGDTITFRDANYSWRIAGTTLVGNYAPNGYSLYDMTGNVAEWCLDAYEEDFYARSPAANPIAGEDSVSQLVNNFTTVDSDTHRVLRGGSWGTGAQFVRVAIRYRDSPAFTNNLLGFRCAWAVTP